MPSSGEWILRHGRIGCYLWRRDRLRPGFNQAFDFPEHARQVGRRSRHDIGLGPVMFVVRRTRQFGIVGRVVIPKDELPIGTLIVVNIGVSLDHRLRVDKLTEMKERAV